MVIKPPTLQIMSTPMYIQDIRIQYYSNLAICITCDIVFEERKINLHVVGVVWHNVINLGIYYIGAAIVCSNA